MTTSADLQIIHWETGGWSLINIILFQRHHCYPCRLCRKWKLWKLPGLMGRDNKIMYNPYKFHKKKAAAPASNASKHRHTSMPSLRPCCSAATTKRAMKKMRLCAIASKINKYSAENPYLSLVIRLKPIPRRYSVDIQMMILRASLHHSQGVNRWNASSLSSMVWPFCSQYWTQMDPYCMGQSITYSP